MAARGERSHASQIRTFILSDGTWISNVTRGANRKWNFCRAWNAFLCLDWTIFGLFYKSTSDKALLVSLPGSFTLLKEKEGGMVFCKIILWLSKNARIHCNALTEFPPLPHSSYQRFVSISLQIWSQTPFLARIGTFRHMHMIFCDLALVMLVTRGISVGFVSQRSLKTEESFANFCVGNLLDKTFFCDLRVFFVFFFTSGRPWTKTKMLRSAFQFDFSLCTVTTWLNNEIAFGTYSYVTVSKRKRKRSTMPRLVTRILENLVTWPEGD